MTPSGSKKDEYTMEEPRFEIDKNLDDLITNEVLDEKNIFKWCFPGNYGSNPYACQK
jgi:hypothetical protein